MAENEFDIVVVGAGLVGTSVVMGLKATGFRIALLNTALPNTTQIPALDKRPLSLAYGSQRCLVQWGLWSSLEASAIPIHVLHLSEQGCLGRLRYSAEEMQLPALGFVLPYALLYQTLYDAALSQTSVSFISVDQVTDLNNDEKGVSLSYVSGGVSNSLSAKLLIAADGKESICRRLLGLSVERYALEAKALVGSLECEGLSKGAAYQRFMSEGSIALLPLFETNHYRLVWTMSELAYQHVSKLTDGDISERVERSYGGRLRLLQDVRREMTFTLDSFLSKKTVDLSVVLLGNAAHTFSPVTAQGFNLSLREVSILTRLLRRARCQNQLVNDPLLLSRYAQYATLSQRKVIQWTRLISKHLYSPMPCFRAMRAAILWGIDSLPFVKKKIMRHFLHV